MHIGLVMWTIEDLLQVFVFCEILWLKFFLQELKLWTKFYGTYVWESVGIVFYGAIEPGNLIVPSQESCLKLPFD